MKLPTLPKFSLAKLSRPKPAARPKRLQATARRAAQPMMDDYDDEPTTRLSSAFIVVFILHVVAVGGIYAFNSIKSQRRSKELTAEVVPPAAIGESVINTSAPAESARTETAASTTAPTPPSVPSSLVSPVSGGRVHKVQSGETLSHLAALYSMSASDIAKANGLESDAKLKLGQALNIPSGRQSVAKAESSDTKKPVASSSPAPAKTKASGAKTYTVVKGDNPVTIARRFGVSYDDLLKLNKISDPRRLQLGQELKIPAKKN